MKRFVKALEKNRAGFLHLLETFPRVSEAWLNAGVFDGPQIREIVNLKINW